MAADRLGAGRFAGNISEGAIAEVWETLGRYRAELDESGLSLSTKMSRYQHAMFFARWLDGHYELGWDRGTQGSK